MNAMKIALTLLMCAAFTLAGEKEKHPDIIQISNGGSSMNLAGLLSTNQVTVVDFHAEWCGPCKATAPYLHALAKTDPQVRLVQVDIVNWESEVAKQFSLKAIPHIRVYLPDGTQVGKSGSSFGTTKMYVKKAKRSL